MRERTYEEGKDGHERQQPPKIHKTLVREVGFERTNHAACFFHLALATMAIRGRRCVPTKIGSVHISGQNQHSS
jgi:hypothetical protein